MEEQEGFLEEDKNKNIVNPAATTPFPYNEKGLNHWSQFGLLLLFTGAGLIGGGIISIIVMKLMVPHVHLLELEKAVLDPANANAMKVVQLLSTIFTFFVPAVMIGLIVHKKPFSYLRFNLKISWVQIGLVVLIAAMALLVGSLLGDLNERIPISKHLQDYFKAKEDEYSEQVLAIAQMNNFKEYLIALFIIALVPAIVEETFFRGTMQQLFISWFRNPWAGIIVTSILFSAIHMSYYGFLTRAMLGVVLGLLYYYGKSIWLNILAHFLNNAVAITLLYVYSLKGKVSKDALEDHYPLWIGLMATIILIFLLIIFKKKSEDFLTKDEQLLLQNNVG
jgi:membrane protease YdiL (CAAX protease family)